MPSTATLVVCCRCRGHVDGRHSCNETCELCHPATQGVSTLLCPNLLMILNHISSFHDVIGDTLWASLFGSVYTDCKLWVFSDVPDKPGLFSVVTITDCDGPDGYHPRKAVPKAAIPKTAVNRPIIEFGGMEDFFHWRSIFTAFLGTAFLARNHL